MESRVSQIIIIITFFTTLPAASLFLRLWTRIGIQNLRLTADDWIIIVTWVFTLAYGINVCTQTRFGLGTHLADLPPNTDFITSNILFYSKQPVYYVAVCLPRISIHSRNLPIQPDSQGLGRLYSRRLFNRLAFFIVNGTLNITQDLVIYILPSRILWNIKIPPRQRLALIAVFVDGFVIIADIVCLPTLKTASSSVDPTCEFVPKAQSFRDHFSPAIWSGIECNIAVICACLVHLKPLIILCVPSFLGLTRFSKGGQNLKLSDAPNKLDARRPDSNEDILTHRGRPDAELGAMSENQTIIMAIADTGVSKLTAWVPGRTLTGHPATRFFATRVFNRLLNNSFTSNLLFILIIIIFFRSFS
ncbi:hypothetical protein RRF57_013285 [Xylaria bambusicola]|uniref:Rhodopsin domain-containing protein n=1 Tax=Xylaria bambusicola TaxID=326684 RepID=A0AAN7URH9_9PEZI